MQTDNLRHAALRRHLYLAEAAAQSQTDASRQAAQAGAASLTRNFYFIFDGSGSMSESLTRQCTGDRRFGSRLEGAKWAVEQFLPLMPRDVNLGLWIFDANGNRERVPLGPDNHGAFLTEVHKTRAGGNTPLTESIEQGVNRLVQQRDQQLGYGEFRLIVVTDGQATGRPLPQAVNYAREQRIPIYTIGLCIGEKHEPASTPCPIVPPIRSKPSSAVSKKHWQRPTCSIPNVFWAVACRGEGPGFFHRERQ